MKRVSKRRSYGALFEICKAFSQERNQGTDRTKQEAEARQDTAYAVNLSYVRGSRDENMNYVARHALRMERAPSVLSELKAPIEAASRTALHRAHLARHLPIEV